MNRWLHMLKHWMQWEPCQNDTEWRGDQLWHYVTCVECGRRVLEFPSHIRRTG